MDHDPGRSQRPSAPAPSLASSSLLPPQCADPQATARTPLRLGAPHSLSNTQHTPHPQQHSSTLDRPTQHLLRNPAEPDPAKRLLCIHSGFARPSLHLHARPDSEMSVHTFTPTAHTHTRCSTPCTPRLPCSRSDHGGCLSAVFPTPFPSTLAHRANASAACMKQQRQPHMRLFTLEPSEP
ncbi:hypothetical protein PMIN05_007541 [Paraphaeosphaeria minitans]